MAQKITDLDELITPDSDDELVIQDSLRGAGRKITPENLMTSVPLTSKARLPHCFMEADGPQTLAHAVWARVALPITLSDPDNWCTDNEHIVVPSNGLYILNASFASSPMSAKTITMPKIIINDDETHYDSISTYVQQQPGLNCCTVEMNYAILNAGDTVALDAYQNGGSTEEIYGTEAYNARTFLRVVRISN